jgi:putrescine aminotransferase
MKKLYSVEDVENLSIENVFDLYKKYINFSQVELISSFGFGQDLIDKAEGMYIYTKDGKKILDFTGGVGVLNHGHNHPRILKIRQEYSKKMKMEVHKNYFSPHLAALSSNIASLLPDKLNYSYFQNSGAEAVEGALKLAYKFHNGERDLVLSSDISFHGKTIAASNITNSIETSYFKFQETLKNDKFIYNSIESIRNKVLEHTINGKLNIYAIVIEPFSASSLKACSEKFLKELRKICSDYKIVLIFDEVYSGWFKTGKIFNFLQYVNLVPDILVTSKSLGGGKSSISAYICTNEIFSKAYGNLKDATLHSTTFNGYGEETVTAIESINIMIEDNYEEKSQKNGKLISQELELLRLKYVDMILETKGSGCLHGIFFDSKILKKTTQFFSKILPISFLKDDQAMFKLLCASVIFHLYKNYNILTYYGSNLGIPLKVSPSVIASEDQIKFFFESLDKTLKIGFYKLLLDFTKNKILNKVKGNLI